MEKQEFLMEINEISQGGENQTLKTAAITMIKEGIRNAAKTGAREFRTYARFNIAIDLNGGTQMNLPFAITLDYFREEGFTTVDQGNGYILISW